MVKRDGAIMGMSSHFKYYRCQITFDPQKGTVRFKDLATGEKRYCAWFDEYIVKRWSKKYFSRAEEARKYKQAVLDRKRRLFGDREDLSGKPDTGRERA